MNETTQASGSDNFNVICPSLKKISTFKILVAMWNKFSYDPMSRVNAIPHNADHGAMRTCNCRMKSQMMESKSEKFKIDDNIKMLPLPGMLKDYLIHFNGFINEQIFGWEHFLCAVNEHKRSYSFRNFIWSSLGPVDKIKTARKMIDDENEPLDICYVIACFFCFKNYIKQIWQKLDNLTKGHFLNSNVYLIKFWSSVNENIILKDRVYKNVFLNCVWMPNEIGVKFFFDFLSPKTRDKFLAKTLKSLFSLFPNKQRLQFPLSLLPDVVCFLFSKMHEHLKIEVARACSGMIITCFSNWPWCANLNKFLNFLWDSDKEVFFKEIFSIQSYNFLLFQEFWQESSYDVQREILQWFGTSENIFEIIRESRNFQMAKLFLKSVNSTAALDDLLQRLNRFNLTCGPGLDDTWESYFSNVVNEIKTLLLLKKNQNFAVA